MGFARKSKRKTEVSVKKLAEKEKAAAIDREVLATYRIMEAESIKERVKRNVPRIFAYCRAYWNPLFGYVLWKEFKFGAKRLADVSQQMDRIQTYGRKQLSVSNMRAALYKEAGYRYRIRPRSYRVNGKDPEVMAQTLASGVESQAVDRLETIWLFAMWEDFSFGPARLQRCREALEKLKQLSHAEYESVLKEMEKKIRPAKIGNVATCLSFNWAREILKELSEPGQKVIDAGLVLKKNPKPLRNKWCA